MRDSAVLLQLAHQAMLELGIDTHLVWQRMGLTQDVLTDRTARTPHKAQLLFWNVLEEVTGDADIGLHLAECMPVYKGQILQYLFLSSPTFGDGLRRALNYQRLLSDAFQGELQQQGEVSFLQMATASTKVVNLRQLSECVVLGLVKFFQHITENRFQVSRIDFSHSQPENTQEHRRFLGGDINFDQNQVRIYFDTAILSHPSFHAEPELLDLHEKLASEHVAKLERQDIIKRVNQVFGEILETGQVSLETVAAKLDIKPRTLRTRLSDADTTFNRLLADYRCNLAKKLLSGTDESIDQIVYLTGFSEPSTFYRAFKRWTELTPVEYRNGRR